MSEHTAEPGAAREGVCTCAQEFTTAQMCKLPGAPPLRAEGPSTQQAVVCAFALLCLPPKPACSLPPQCLALQCICSLACTHLQHSCFCKCCTWAPVVFCRFTQACSFRCQFQVLWQVYLGIYYPIPLACFIPGHPARSSQAPLDLAKKSGTIT